MNKWVEGRVVGHKRWTEELYSLQVEAPVAPFEAGQFTQLALDIAGKRVARSYSYVNAPREYPLEFYYAAVPDGPLTTSLPALSEGETIWVSPKARGTLTLANVPPAAHLWMLSTGTAVGPFLSILKTDEPWQRFSHIVLAHGVRTRDELAYQDTIDSISEQHADQFSLVPFVTREDTDFAIRSRIPEAIERGVLEQAAGENLSPESAQVMICGNTDMIKDSRAVLESRGFRRNRRNEPGHIHLESYY